jgi:diphthamide synthase (EF-2-diphthine--ammonia ligase)
MILLTNLSYSQYPIIKKIGEDSVVLITIKQGEDINKKFIEDAKELNKKYKIHIAGEGGEFESFVLNCPLFKKQLKVKSYNDISTGENS